MTDERIKEEFGLFMARSVPIRDIDLSRTLTGSVGDFDNIMIQSHAVGFIAGFRTAERLAKIEAAENGIIFMQERLVPGVFTDIMLDEMRAAILAASDRLGAALDESDKGR